MPRSTKPASRPLASHAGDVQRGIGDNFPFAVEFVATETLTLLDNLRVYSSSERRNLRRIGRRFGLQHQPLVVDDMNRVIIGEQALIAAKECQIAEMPVIRLATLGELEAKALMVAYQRLGEIGKTDHAKLAEIVLRCEVELDFDVEEFGYEVAQIDLIIGADVDDVEEEPPALQRQPVTELGDRWVMDNHSIVCGDALEGRTYDELLEGSKAQAAFADAPYGGQIDGFVAGRGRHREFVMGSVDMSAGELSRFYEKFNKEMALRMAPGAVVYEAIDFRSLDLLLRAASEVFGPLVNLAVWVKDRPGQGSFLRSQHELILIFKNKGRMRNNVLLGKHGRNRSNVWSYPSALTASKGSEEGNILSAHPTPKPTRLIADALLDTTKRGDIVLDPFSGSGSTLIACEKTGRRARLIELDPLYVDLAVRRWQAWTGGKAVHAITGESFDERAARLEALAQAAE